MSTDFSIDDTDVYTEAKKEFSMQGDINSLLEWKRKNTTSAINSNQKGLIPYFANIKWEKNTTYFENGSYQILRNYFKIGLSVEGLPNNRLFNTKDIIYYNENMADAVNKTLVEPFLLFINKVHIAWSRINIVRSDDKISLLISDIDKDTTISDVKVIVLPPNIVYTEGADQDPTLTLLFRFGSDGRYDKNNSIFVSTPDKYLTCNSYGNTVYQDYDMTLPYNRKITSDNLFIFDVNGQLEDKSLINIVIKNTNLITLDSAANKFRYIVCCYNTQNDLNEANMMRAHNIPFEKALVSGTAGFEALDYNLFLDDFDFDHNRNLPYATNIANSLDYVFGYDENKLDDVFMKIRPVNIMEFDPNTLLLRYRANGEISMPRDMYRGDRSTTFPIIFHNGMIPSYYNSIKYTPSTFRFTPYSDMYSTPGFSYKDKFEIAFCRNVRNDLIKLDLTKRSDPNYLNMGNFFIPKEDIVVYSACRGETNLFPINYSISGNNIVLKENKYLDGQLYIGSRNQFIYERYTSGSTTNKIDLSTRFRTAYDDGKYMVFINGRYMNSISYRILIPSMNNGKILKRSIFLLKTIKAGDRVDVFYCGVPNMDHVQFNGDLLIQCIKVKATSNGQSRFKVPYPYRNYPRSYDSFFCIKHSAYVDKSKYIIDGDYIQINDSDNFLNFAQDLIFVFPYYRPEWENDGEVDENAILQFKSRYTTLSADSSVVNFTPDSLGNVTTSSVFHIFINTTYIEPSRYTLTATNQITMNDGVIIPAGTLVTMTVEANNDLVSTSDVLLEAISVKATQTQQLLFDIPKTDYYDSLFVIKGTVLLAPERYFITDENKLLIVNEDDYIDAGDSLTFVFAKDKNEASDPNYHYHIKTEFMWCTCIGDTSSIHIPTNYYHRFKFSQDNVVMFANSVCIVSDRYSISNNEVTMNDPNDVFFRDGSYIVFMIAYKTINYKRVDGEIQNREIIYFQDVPIQVVANGQTTFLIPYPLPPFTDTEFFISKAANIINPEMYSISSDRKTLTYYDKSLIIGNELRFTFVHNGGFTHISKSQINVKLAGGQNEVDIPSPYNKLVNLNNRMIITYGNLYLDKDRYIIDNKARKVLLYDIPNDPGEANRSVTFTFFYTGSDYNGAIAYLPQSGYVCFLRKNIISNFNKDMYMMFVNGRKIAKSEIIDMSNNLVKVSTDIQRNYDLVVLNCSPIVTELKGRYGTMSEWTKMLDPLPI